MGVGQTGYSWELHSVTLLYTVKGRGGGGVEKARMSIITHQKATKNISTCRKVKISSNKYNNDNYTNNNEDDEHINDKRKRKNMHLAHIQMSNQ